MRVFDVTDCRAEIIRPGANLTQWAAANKPFAVCNASLYDMRTHVPTGTIIEDGKVVHDDGNGYGFGVVSGKPGFGNPWAKDWDYYLTGYNSPVQDGKYVAPTWKDSYVFGCRLVRIGVGLLGGRVVIVTDDYVTLKEFADHAIAAGVSTLVNLDGGGSRHLYYDGKAVYSSPRVPYNAIAFYKPEPVCEFCTDDGRCKKWREAK